MTGNKCILDTSVIIHSFKSKNEIAGKLDSMDEIYVPVTAIGELYYGAYKSSDPSKHFERIQSFLLNCKILLTDTTTADIYGKIKAALTKKGKPIPENDLLIGAAALQYSLPLYTTDQHFEEIDDIKLL